MTAPVPEVKAPRLHGALNYDVVNGAFTDGSRVVMITRLVTNEVVTALIVTPRGARALAAALQNIAPPPTAVPTVEPEPARGGVPWFRRALLAWVLTVVVIVASWAIYRAAQVDEAAGAWLGLAALFVVIVGLVAYATRGTRR